MDEQPLNKSSEENQPDAQSNIKVGDINVGNVDGSFIVGNNNTINIPAKQAFLSLHQLPQPPADFTGREELIAQLLADFDQGKGATITGQPIHGLVGMGGIGKTALGLVVAHQLKKDYPDAQIFLDLKGTTAPLSAMDAMRHVILSFEPLRDLKELDEKGMSDSYQSVLHGKGVLLFLDNARSADHIAPLRPPETCALLVTSRWTFGVPGLKNRHMGVMNAENAEKFLLELCPRIGDQADELAKACAYLPLALRIAGSFLGVNTAWNIERYITQLNDRKGRLATLKQSHTDAELTTEPDLLATFELSYSQLSEENQKRWRMLGIFPGWFDAGAASAVWELEEDPGRKSLGIFLRYSLLDYEETSARYSLHDLLGDYALSQIKGEEIMASRTKHASYYRDTLRLANELYLLGGENILMGLRLFDLEWENIKAGQSWAAARKDPALSELCIAYPDVGAYTLYLRQPPQYRIQWLGTALSAAREIGDRQGEGHALCNLGAAYADLGDVYKAIEYYEQNLAIAREIGERQGEGQALGGLGIAYNRLGERRKAIEYTEQSLTIAREIGDQRSEEQSLGQLGIIYKDLGEIRKAIGYYEQRLAIVRKIGDRRGEGNTLNNLGIVYAILGEVRKAIEYYEGQLAIARELGDRQGEVAALGNLGNNYNASGEVRKAIEFHETALVIAREIGDRFYEATILGNLGLSYYSLGKPRKALDFYEQQLVIVRQIGDPNGEGRALFNKGLALYDLNEKAQAIHATQQALVIFEQIESPNAEAVRYALKKWGVRHKEQGKGKSSSWMDQIRQKLGGR